MAKYIRVDGKNKPRFNASGYDSKTLERLRNFPHLMQTSQARQDWTAGISGDLYLTPNERLLGINIIRHLNLKTQRCYPPQKTLAALLGVTPRSIIRMTQQLEHAGWIGVARHRNVPHGGKGKLANTYCPLVPQALRDAVVTMRNQGDTIDVQGDIKRVHSDTQTSPQQGIYNREDSTFSTSYCHAERVAPIEDQKGARQESKEPKQYTSEDVELLQEALNDGDKTFAGIIAATGQPGSIGDGSGFHGTTLRYLLNDCMQAKLVAKERRNGKDYFVYDGVGCDWVDVLANVTPEQPPEPYKLERIEPTTTVFAWAPQEVREHRAFNEFVRPNIGQKTASQWQALWQAFQENREISE